MRHIVYYYVQVLKQHFRPKHASEVTEHVSSSTVHLRLDVSVRAVLRASAPETEAPAAAPAQHNIIVVGSPARPMSTNISSLTILVFIPET